MHGTLVLVGNHKIAKKKKKSLYERDVSKAFDRKQTTQTFLVGIKNHKK